MTTAPQAALQNEMIAALNTCIEICIDGEKGYGAAAADVREPTLKSVFRAYERQRADFVADLQRMIDARGYSHENEGRVCGALHRGWTSARLQLEGRNDDVIVDECMRGETAALHSYDRLIRRGDAFSADVRATLIRQRATIAAALEEMKNRLAFPGCARASSMAGHVH